MRASGVSLRSWTALIERRRGDFLAISRQESRGGGPHRLSSPKNLIVYSYIKLTRPGDSESPGSCCELAPRSL
jgi:hypothetical protein